VGIFRRISIWEPYDMCPYEMWEKFDRELGWRSVLGASGFPPIGLPSVTSLDNLEIPGYHEAELGGGGM